MENTNRTHRLEPRKFLGKTENFENKDERHFFQRMLKAYLQGRKFFDFGIDKFGNKNSCQVLQS